MWLLFLALPAWQCGISVLQPGIKPAPPVLEEQSLNHWTAREVFRMWFLTGIGQEKTLESPLDCKEIKLVNPKGNQSWIFIGRTASETEAPILWPPDGKSWLTGKDPDAGEDWGQEETGMTEEKMAGWHHRLNGHEFEQAPGAGAWRAAVHGVTKSWTQLRDWTELK